MEFVLGALLLYSIIGVISTTPIVWFSRKPIIWNKFDLLIGLIPLFIYIGVHTLGPAKGGASNFIVESVLMALILPIASAAFFSVENNFQRNVLRLIFIIVAVAAAVGLRLFIPEMPD